MSDQRIEMKRDDDGLFAIAASSVAMLGEKTVAASFGILRDVRGEVSQRSLSLIDWVDSAQQSSTKLLRSAVQRLDDVVLTSIEAGERVGLAVVRTVHTTSDGAAQFASRTASSLTSTRQNGAASASA